MAEIVKTIRPSGQGGDYTSLTSWEAAEQTDLVTAGNTHVAEIQGDWSATLVDNVSLAGWTCDNSHTITIRTDAANKASSVWNSAKATLKVTGGANGIGFYTGACGKVEGLQLWMESIDTTVLYGVRSYGTSLDVIVDGCFFKGSINAGTGSLIAASNNAVGVRLIVANCIFWNMVNGTALSYGILFNGGTTVNNIAYNNTIHGCYMGIREIGTLGSILKNNLVTATAGIASYNYYGTFDTTNSATNACDVADTTGAASDIASATVVYRDSANGDFRIRAGSTSLVGAATDLSADGTYPISTDIDGTVRASWDIGATERIILEVLKTIAPSGGDYTSISAWEAAEQADLVTLDESHVAEIQGDWSGGPDTASCVIAGWTSDATHTITVRADAANKASAVWDTNKYRLERTGYCLYVDAADFVTIQGLQLRITSTTVTYADVLRINTPNLYTTTIDGCFIVHDSNGLGCITMNLRHVGAGNTRTVYIKNVILVATYPSATNVYLLSMNLSDVYGFNITGYGGWRGFYQNSGTGDFRNCIVNGPTAVCYGGLSGETSYCISSMADISGTGDQASTTVAFENPAGLDMRLAATDTAAQGKGTSLYSDATLPVTTDIAGTSRGTASATAFDIGAHHQANPLRTIEPSGGNYTSGAAWEAAEQTDLVANNKNHTAEIRGDWSAEPIDAGIMINGWTTDATHFVTLQTDAANRHAGKIDTSKFLAYYYGSYHDYTVFKGLQAQRAASNCYYLNAANVLIDSCIAHYTGTSIDMGFYLLGASVTLRNCIAYADSNAYGYGFGRGDTSGTYTYHNCTAYGLQYGFRRSAGTHNATNCIAQGCGTSILGITWTSCLTSGVVFVDAANGDFRLDPSDTAAQLQGVDLSASGVTVDIAGVSRGTAPTAMDIGAHHSTSTFRTVKPTGQGGNYTSLSAWDAGESVALVAHNKNHIVEIQGDWSAEGFDGGVVVSDWSADATHFVTIRTDSANRASLKWSEAKFKTYYINATACDYTYVKGIQGKRATTVFSVTVDGHTGQVFDSCFAWYTGTNSTIGIIQLYGDWGVAVNCVVVGSGTTYGRAYLCSNGINSIYNCVSYNCNYAFRRSTGSMRVVNHLDDYCPNHSSSATTTSWGPNDGSVPFADPTNATEPDFTLASSDANIVGAATDMSTDALYGQYPYTVDMEGQERSSWDIGADEYTASAGSNFTQSCPDSISFSDSETNFTSKVLADSITLADAISSSLLVSQTCSDALSVSDSISLFRTVFKTIKPAGQGGDYSTLSSWEAGEQTDLVAANSSHVAEIQGSWSGPDTSYCAIQGWTTGPNNTITLRTDSQNYPTGKWDGSRFINETSSNSYGLTVSIPWVTIDGIQVDRAPIGVAGAGIQLSASAGNIVIRNCMVRLRKPAGSTVDPVGIQCNSSSFTGFFVNNVIYATNTLGTWSYGIYAYFGTAHYLFNNTIYGTSLGIRANGQALAINNLVAGILNGANSYYGTWVAESDYNVTDSTDTLSGSTGVNNLVSQSFAFRNPSSGDFRLLPADTGARGNGLDLSSNPDYPFSTDISGQTRIAWDAGSDEYAEILNEPMQACSSGLAISDSASCVFSFVKQLTDSITIADAIAVSGSASLSQSCSSGLTLSDASTRVFDYATALSDALTLADALGASCAFVRAFSDAISASDSVSTASTIVVSTSDAITLADTASASASFVAAVSDAVSLSDSAKKFTSKLLSDTATLADALSKAAQYVRAYADSVVLGDFATTSESNALQRSVADSLSLADSVSTVTSYVRALSDGYSLSDSALRAFSFARSLSDAVSLGDAFATANALSKAVSDSLSLSDALNTSSVTGSAVSDSLTLSDIATKAVAKALTDSVVISDALSRAYSASRTFADSVTLSDSALKKASVSYSDSFTVSDNCSVTTSTTVQASDPITLADAYSSVLGRVVEVSDTITLTDFTSKTVRLHTVEALVLSTSVAKLAAKHTADGLVFSESVLAWIPSYVPAIDFSNPIKAESAVFASGKKTSVAGFSVGSKTESGE